jgi:predicted nucleic acid-binding protein
VERHIFDAPERTVAPDLLNSEVLHAVRRFERVGIIARDEADDAARQLEVLPIFRYPTTTLIERAWSLRHNFTAYDAMYVALAEALETPLVTADAHLARSVRDHSHAAVVLLSA